MKDRKKKKMWLIGKLEFTIDVYDTSRPNKMQYTIRITVSDQYSVHHVDNRLKV